jgi:hypothetical protein
MSNESKPETPFPRHRYYYIAIKLIVIVVAIYLAFKYFGGWRS